MKSIHLAKNISNIPSFKSLFLEAKFKNYMEFRDYIKLLKYLICEGIR